MKTPCSFKTFITSFRCFSDRSHFELIDKISHVGRRSVKAESHNEVYVWGKLFVIILKPNRIVLINYLLILTRSYT